MIYCIHFVFGDLFLGSGFRDFSFFLKKVTTQSVPMYFANLHTESVFENKNMQNNNMDYCRDSNQTLNDLQDSLIIQKLCYRCFSKVFSFFIC